MKLGVIGSRSFRNYKTMEKLLDTVEISEIISGGAQGADYCAEIYAKEKNIPITIFYPEWKKGGVFARNKKIVEASDLIVAFWDGKSAGTKMTLSIAERMNKPTVVIEF